MIDRHGAVRADEHPPWSGGAGVPDALRWRAVPPQAPSLFRRDVRAANGAYAAFYAPGCLCVVPQSHAGAFEAQVAAGGAAGGWAAQLAAAAADARHRAQRLADLAFRPECLTLYLNHVCNLRCTYCYADPLPAGAPAAEPPATLDLAAIASAAHLVAANCRERALPFRAALHGGGEPLLDPDFARTVLDLLDGVAQQHRVQPFYYVATNGVIPEAVAHWLARRVHLVGLSCDGPPPIHDSQRQSRAGRPTLHVVERTARVLRAAGVRFHVRATVTHRSLCRLPEVVDDICRRLAPAEIHLEPVYAGGRSGSQDSLGTGDAAAFVAGYLSAADVARAHGVRLTTSGSRLDGIHGPYCHLFRQVLNLVPGGVATACFKMATAADARRQGTIVGAYDPSTGRFDIDYGQVAALRARLSQQPARCGTCLNRYHCAGDCPDVCPLDRAGRQAVNAGFRCTTLHSLSGALLDRRSGELWAEVAAGGSEAPHGTRFA